MRRQEEAGTSLERALLDLGLIDEPRLAAAKAAQAGVAFADLAATPADPRAAQTLPAQLGAALQDAAGAAFTQGLHLVFAVNAGLALGIAVLVAVLLRGEGPGEGPDRSA